MDVKSGLFLLDDYIPIEYEGPTDPEEMWKSDRFVFVQAVKVGTARLMRTRPKFEQWALNFRVRFNEEVLSEFDVQEFLTIGGWQVGLCEWRPRFGRFKLAKFS